VARGEVVGPTIVLYAPSINGQNTTTPEQARQRVRDAKAAGYDGIKTHGGFGADVYDALADEARRAGLPLAGHVTPGFGLERAVAAGQQVEHLDGVLAALMTPGAPVPPGQLIVDPAELARVDERRIAALARDHARRGVYHGPTLALFENVMSDAPGDSLARRAEMRYAAPQAVQQWTGQKNMQLQNGGPAEGRARFLGLRRTIVRELHLAGAKLMAGSDSPQFFMTPGYGLHRELQALVGAGLPPWAALQAATRVPAEYLGRAELGTVAEGKRADLLLLDADPLADVRNAERVAGVLVQGRWIPGDALRARLVEVERAVKD
jgi:imidazolonepropionase-like amidohydrolase